MLRVIGIRLHSISFSDLSEVFNVDSPPPVINLILIETQRNKQLTNMRRNPQSGDGLTVLVKLLKGSCIFYSVKCTVGKGITLCFGIYVSSIVFIYI